MGYLYETHLHTCLSSACGVSTGKEHVRFYKAQGYTGIIMTDHFFRGNTAVSRDRPWEERVDLFWRGYEDALEEGLKVGLDVFFAYEENHVHDEYLIYGLTRDYMKAHPEMEHWTRREQLEAVHAAGGAVIQAHPFRVRNYIDIIRVGDLFADGIEAANAGNAQLDDARAYAFGKEKGLLMTAGSDNHHSPMAQPFGVGLEEKLTSVQDYANLLRRGGPVGLHVPEGRFAVPDGAERLPAWRLDEKETLHSMQEPWL
ncbi:MAG: PHP domain-containing protein [Clostridia bacterium]|nr:PHP domain-containing protein [Clostridia bacterium]